MRSFDDGDLEYDLQASLFPAEPGAYRPEALRAHLLFGSGVKHGEAPNKCQEDNPVDLPSERPFYDEKQAGFPGFLTGV
jgi:hypothetical protein